MSKFKEGDRVRTPRGAGAVTGTDVLIAVRVDGEFSLSSWREDELTAIPTKVQHDPEVDRLRQLLGTARTELSMARMRLAESAADAADARRQNGTLAAENSRLNYALIEAQSKMDVAWNHKMVDLAVHERDAEREAAKRMREQLKEARGKLEEATKANEVLRETERQLQDKLNKIAEIVFPTPEDIW